ncbi:MAG: hypothetical protein KatS3mg105_2150 [Gemmatales bacterium]|nr:MAG: hypothetical protein KatS3mg105_2150 [Gemmatales bacterium]
MSLMHSSAIFVVLSLAASLVPAPDGKRPAEGKTDPPGVPLEAVLIDKAKTYRIDLGGVEPKAFQQAIKQAEKIGGRLPPSPKVDFVLRVKNVGKKDITIWSSGSPVAVRVHVEGKGALVATPLVAFPAIYQIPMPKKLAPGQTVEFPIKSLAYLHPSGSKQYYWIEPGDYSVTASLITGVSPIPEGAKMIQKDFGRVTITSSPITVKVAK